MLYCLHNSKKSTTFAAELCNYAHRYCLIIDQVLRHGEYSAPLYCRAGAYAVCGIWQQIQEHTAPTIHRGVHHYQTQKRTSADGQSVIGIAMLLSQEMDNLSLSTSHMQIGELYGMVQVQALLESMKEIYGWLLFLAILCLIGLMLRYSGIRPVKVIEPTYRFIHNFLRNNTGLLRLRRSKVKEEIVS